MNYKRLILPLAVVALLFVSCDGADGQYSEEPYDTHPHWTSDSTDNFWDKHLGTGGYVACDESLGAPKLHRDNTEVAPTAVGLTSE